MKYYIDITLVPNSEENLAFIWSKLYAQMHLALVEMKNNNDVAIGFSFPYYNTHVFPLGDTLRIFAETKIVLENLDLDKWLNRLDGYIHRGVIKEVPSDTKEFVSFGRKQFKTNKETLARRQAKRKGISYQEALQNYQNFDEDKNKTKLPYINVKSLSTGKEMKLFINKSDIKEREDGLFSTYGLSNTSTVPWF